MPAPKGHPLWGNPLNPKKYTPEEFWDKFVQYKEWNEQNPIMIVEQSKQPQRIPTGYKGSLKKFLSQLIHLPHPRALSIEKFCIFANISFDTFTNYSKGEGYETYFEVSKRIRAEIDAQHFEGGMTGVFNANLTSRKLGLVDKNQTELNIPNLNINVNSEKTKENIQKLSE